MQKFLTLFFIALLSLGLAITDANAKRLGGGKSIGKQRESVSQQAAPKPPAPAPAAAPAPAGNRWLGPLAGLAAGGLLASLFMGHGFDGIKAMDILLMLLLAGGIFFIFRAMRNKSAPAPQPMQYAGLGSHPSVPAAEPAASAAPAPAATKGSRPDWFEDEPFLRSAKANFIRLQAANDAGDLNDIREFTTPEMFAEISLQIQERGGKPQKTDVVTMIAEMVEVVTEGDLVIASVRFRGLIREEEHGPADPFNEIWHVQKSLSQPNATWRIAGIQQAG
ncbi:MAG: Tim44-like domain-containing protein [Pseudomonadota bacterium]